MCIIRVVHSGLGSLGRMVVRSALQRRVFQVVAAVDPAPGKAGKDLGDLCGLGPLGITVRPNLRDALEGRAADVALLTSVSRVAELEPQVQELARAGLHIVSTCEELAFPWDRHPEAARRIDAVCKENSVVCLSTGVNPGYLMDFLPTVLSGLCQNVEAVKVWRVQDASTRRVPFQQKIGAGLTLEEFKASEPAGALCHVGLLESLDLIAHRLGWKLERTTESLEPITARQDIHSGHAPIFEGMVCGVQQVARGFVGPREAITLIFRATVGEPHSYDRIVIEGIPPIESTIIGGVNGDIATCAVTLNAVRSVLAARPGLKTMCDIPPVAFFDG